MIIHLVAGGPGNLLPDLSNYAGQNVIWAGVDRGVIHLLERNIKPAIAFGDFDSVNSEEFLYIEKQVIELQTYQPEKDETDMELALNWAIKQNPDLIRLFGATGGRLDHLMANVHLLIPPLLNGTQVEIHLIDRLNQLYVKGPGSYKIAKSQQHKYISFIPIIKDVPDLTLKGFKYPLKNRHISIGSTLCISNELIDDYGTFSFSEGILLVVRSDD
jgi:thiamine pyrophosphokinase